MKHPRSFNSSSEVPHGAFCPQTCTQNGNETECWILKRKDSSRTWQSLSVMTSSETSKLLQIPRNSYHLLIVFQRLSKIVCEHWTHSPDKSLCVLTPAFIWGCADAPIQSLTKSWWQDWKLGKLEKGVWCPPLHMNGPWCPLHKMILHSWARAWSVPMLPHPLLLMTLGKTV